MSELLKKIPTEKCWEITSKILTGFIVLRAVKIIVPLLGKMEGIFAPVLAKEKWQEINEKIMVDGSKQFFPMVKEMFNIPVEDVIGVAKCMWVAFTLFCGPELKGRFVEATPERVVCRWTKCPWWNRSRENEVEPVLMACPAGHKVWDDEGLKVINPKLTYKMTKFMPKGDPYCEFVIEFKDE